MPAGVTFCGGRGRAFRRGIWWEGVHGIRSAVSSMCVDEDGREGRDAGGIWDGPSGLWRGYRTTLSATW